MPASRNRRRIAAEAARLLFERTEHEYHAAKFKAAKHLGVTLRHRPSDLPTNSEVRKLIRELSESRESDGRDYGRLRDTRLAALRLMRVLATLRPRLASDGDDGRIALFVSCDDTDALAELLGLHDIEYEIDDSDGAGTPSPAVRIRLDGAVTCEVILDRTATIQSSGTAADSTSISIADLESRIATQHPDVDLPAIGISIPTADPYLVWSMLLPPLEAAKQDPKWHPEGDALYHSLQAFELARQRFSYDEELITAALLHDVGKAIESTDHVAAGLGALEGTISPRVEFLIARHMDALAYLEGTLAQRLRNELRASEWLEDLLNLREIDNDARQRGVEVCTVDEAIEFLRRMATEH
ncbi:MAG: tRNA adenylyltransferase [Planctomycetes bacterium]|nr:tRNA adenylyltransferase [Planctomycetota bacterium]